MRQQADIIKQVLQGLRDFSDDLIDIYNHSADEQLCETLRNIECHCNEIQCAYNDLQQHCRENPLIKALLERRIYNDDKILSPIVINKKQ